MGKVNASQKKAKAFLTLKEGALLDPAALRSAVVKAGFTPRELTMTAQGSFVLSDGMQAFKVDGSGQLFRLEENAELARFKSEGSFEGKVLTITAKVIGDAQPLTLQLLSQEVQPMSKKK